MQKSIRTAACLAAGAVLISGGAITVNAAPADNHLQTVTALSEKIHEKVSTEVSIAAKSAEKIKQIEEAEKKLGVDVEKTAVAQVNDYVNVRKSASEKSEAVGKLYDNAVATVENEKDGWYQIKSGSVKGYVKADYVKVGDVKLIESAASKVATVNTTTLKVREKASTDASVLNLVAEGEKLKTSGKEEDGWLKVSVDGETGYVSSEYVEVSMSYKKAVSKAEEEKKAEKKQASAGSAVASYAGQFVGNPYVWGGTSLTNGADCSGFVMSVYAHFGVSLPHSSSALRGVGRSVSLSEIQPGDIVCYSGHVGIYAGNNTLVHASNKKDGIKYTSPVNYRQILAIRRIF
ncbi:Probable endopeptidase cgR_2070 precursor [uncultured Roseburia sp.]|uniref:NlpC/P60 family protein n=1 Tax=Brotonthovivens ammoniilytica TaxID=2981725 RepID=A0ABT2TM04_9FIRM|nr:C40 family peptidase [Brotonthovivens ammoniilytica]MCU6763248.1 NlpC/P60 family protein [Brotonthovivens ammoniilytica]SCJ10730.1 Probable endopeptidase cgR_2070 precursor [uncultured Roseburia sp.]